MKMLVVHDRAEVANQIEDMVLAHCSDAIVHRSDNVLHARDLLRDNLYDLAIVDLTLPIDQGNKDTSLEHADLLLREIFERDAINKPADILGISKEPDVIALVNTSIGQHLMACIEEDASDLWRTALTQKLRYIDRARASRQRVTNESYDYDVMIITALDKEAKPYRDMFELRKVEGFPNVQAFSFACKSGKMRRGILFSAGTSGQARAASAAQALLMYFRPRLALMTGFCGGVAERTKFGDLLIFRSSYAWDYGKWVEEKVAEDQLRSIFKARPTPLNVLENGVIEDVRAMLRDGYAPPLALTGEIAKMTNGAVTSWNTEPVATASGSAVVTSLDIVAQIQDLDENIWGIEMESYAFYLACLTTPVVKPDFVCLKAVADHCNGEKNSRMHAPCSLISANFAYALITGHYDFR
jgi:nucleoside phosphorylase